MTSRVICIQEQATFPSSTNLRFTCSSYPLQLTRDTHQRVVLGPAFQRTPVNLPNVLETRHVHQDIEFSKQAPHDVQHARLAHDAQAPDPQAPDEDKLCAQRERFEYVGRGAHTGVVCDVGLVSDSYNNPIVSQRT
jgi:hypothetical protein